MDNKSYLNQISASSRPTQKSTISNLFSSPLAKVLAIGVAALIVILIIGSIIGGNNDNTKNKTIALSLHTDNLLITINEYQPTVKSSNLRSSSASLYSILGSTSSALTTYLTAKYNLKEKDIDEKLSSTETALYDSLNADLAEAKINGLLDRTYARQMAYEISVIMNREAEIYKNMKDEGLKTSLLNSYDSLEKLYNDFDSFSESK